MTLLYQYVSRSVGLEILRNQKVGFRRPKYFNDPFEFVLATVQPGYDAALIEQQMLQMRAPIHRAMLEWSQTMLAVDVICMNCVVLCLTTEPLNALMWSHYTQQLDGLVIGYDVSTDFFRGYNNACPIQFGNVVYVPNRPEPHRQELNIAPLENWFYKPFVRDNLGVVQKVFLTKPQRWSYENEIRIVKRLNDESESNIRQKIEPQGRELFLYDLPPRSIREVYSFFHPMVLHALKAHPGVGGGESPAKFRDFVLNKVGAKFFAVTASQRSWEFDVAEIT